MGNLEFTLNRDGVRALLKSSEMLSVCESYASKAAARCGDGYVMHDVHYPERNGAVVAAATLEAVKDNYNHNTILKSLGG